MEHMSQVRGQQIFSIKDKRVNILGFVGHVVSVANTQPCHCNAKVIMLKRYINIWLVAHILPIPLLALSCRLRGRQWHHQEKMKLDQSGMGLAVYNKNSTSEFFCFSHSLHNNRSKSRWSRIDTLAPRYQVGNQPSASLKVCNTEFKVVGSELNCLGLQPWIVTCLAVLP